MLLRKFFNSLISLAAISDMSYSMWLPSVLYLCWDRVGQSQRKWISVSSSPSSIQLRHEVLWGISSLAECSQTSQWPVKKIDVILVESRRGIPTSCLVVFSLYYGHVFHIFIRFLQQLNNKDSINCKRFNQSWNFTIQRSKKIF